MLDPLFQEAFCHRAGGHTVLGRKLHPLCAFDVMSLEAIDSPFLISGSSCQASDLLLAVWLLSNPVSDDLTIGHLELNAAGATWIKTITDQLDLAKEVAAVDAYFADYYSPPEVMQDAEPNPLSALGAPWILSAVILVCSKLHLPLRTAWTMGLGQLLWYRSAVAEMENPDIRIVSQQLREQMIEAQKPQVVFKMELGESLADFAKRVGLDELTAATMLHQGGQGHA